MAHFKCMPIAYLLWMTVAVAATHTTNTTTTISTATSIDYVYPEGCSPEVFQITLGMVFGGLFYFMCTWSMIGALISNLYYCRETWRLRRLHRDNKGVTQVDATVTNKRPECYLNYTFTGTHPDHGPFRVTRKDLGIEESLYEELKVGGSVPVCYSDADPKNCALEHYISKARNEKHTHLYGVVGFLLVVVAAIAAVTIWILHGCISAMNLPVTIFVGSICLVAMSVGFGYGCNTCCSGRKKLIIRYGEDVESGLPNDSLPVLATADMATTDTDGVATAALPVAEVEMVVHDAVNPLVTAEVVGEVSIVADNTYAVQPPPPPPLDSTVTL